MGSSAQLRPALTDFHAAVMKKLGSSLREGFLFPGTQQAEPGWALGRASRREPPLLSCGVAGFALSCAMWALVYFLALRMTRSRLAGALALVLILGAGGMGGINHFLQHGYAHALSVDSAQNDVTGDGKLFWFAFIPHVFLPQV